MRQTIAKLRERTRGPALALRGMARRLVVGVTGGSGLWQLLGYEGIEGERETFDNVEVFQAVGYYARPKASGKAEVVLLNVGGESGHPVVIASRDRSIQLDLAEDETAIFNSSASVTIKADGSIVIRAKAGKTVSVDDGSGASQLATLRDVQTFREELLLAYNAHTHPVQGSVAAAPSPMVLTAPVGTSVLRGK